MEEKKKRAEIVKETSQGLRGTIATELGEGSRFVDLMHVDSGAISTQPVRLAGGDTPKNAIFHRLPEGVHRVTFRSANKRKPAISDYVVSVEK